MDQHSKIKFPKDFYNPTEILFKTYCSFIDNQESETCPIQKLSEK